MNSMTFNNKLWALIGVFAVGLIFTGLFSFSTLNQVKVNGPIYQGIAQQKDLLADILPPPEYLIESYLVSLQMTIADKTALPALIEKSQSLAKDFEERRQYWAKELPDGEAKNLLIDKAYKPGKEFIDLQLNQFIPALQRGDANAIEALHPQMEQKYAEHRAAIDELVKVSTATSTEQEQEAAAVIQRKSMLSAAMIVGFLLLGGGVSWWILRDVMRQLGGDPQEVLNMVKTMSSGNLLLQPNKKLVEDSLLANAYRMQTSLRDMIAKVKDQTNQVEDMARSLAVAARQIAENVNHESDAVSSMASAIEEMSVSTAHISDQGGNAKQIADASRSGAEQGAQVVNKTVTGLLLTAQEIETASGEVSRLGEDATRIIDVVKVIKEIADQTNLLALNAAIEAARAGEQGRGFAVVADEVRKLAERTGNATNEINQMSGKISEVVSHALDSMGKVVETTRQGVIDAETAQNSIASIQQSFSEVANVIEEISTALTEQNVASGDLAKSTERVAQMSGDNSSAAQGLLNLANELEGKAAQVRGAVDVFKV